VLRTVSNSFEFAGYTVPAGTLVMVGTAVGHMLDEYFPNPENFDIDRYSKARAEHRQRDAYAPFGTGTHRCLGSELVPLQLSLTMATILRDLALQPVAPNYLLRVRSFPTMQPVGFRIQVVSHRTHNATTMGQFA
jgi:cytochrome P450